MTKKKKAPRSPAPKKPAGKSINRIWRVKPHVTQGGRPGLLVTRGQSLDRPLAFIPIDKLVTAGKAMRLARHVARDPSFMFRSDGVVVLGGEAGGEVPGWVYSLECVPLESPEQPVEQPRPFCPVRFARMQRQAAEMAEKTVRPAGMWEEGGPRPPISYWDAYEEAVEIAARVEENGAAGRLKDVLSDLRESGGWDNATIHHLEDIVREFWRLPETERERILNGWRWWPANARESRERYEAVVTSNALLSVLTIHCGGEETNAEFDLIPGEATHRTRLHVRIGTTEEEVTKDLDAIRRTVQGNWPALIHDPDLVAGVSVDTAERDDLADALDDLEPLVNANLPQGHPVRRLFEQASPAAHGPADAPPTVEVMRAALDAFQGMPAGERQRVLNGWAPAERIDRLTMLHLYDTESLGTSLRVSEKHATVQEFFDSGIEGVYVQIRLGTTRAEAMAGLDAVRAKLEAEWASLIVAAKERE